VRQGKVIAGKWGSTKMNYLTRPGQAAWITVDPRPVKPVGYEEQQPGSRSEIRASEKV
jgi:hypothetical protein